MWVKWMGNICGSSGFVKWVGKVCVAVGGR